MLTVKQKSLVLSLSLKISLEKCVPFVCAGQTEKYATLSFDVKYASALKDALVGCFGEELNWAKLKVSRKNQTLSNFYCTLIYFWLIFHFNHSDYLYLQCNGIWSCPLKVYSKAFTVYTSKYGIL